MELHITHPWESSSASTPDVWELDEEDDIETALFWELEAVKWSSLFDMKIGSHM